jgi:vacuolar-type H+-ATPase subunit I/STV1
MKTILIASLAILVSSCTSMSPKECKVADWKVVGYQDALRGSNTQIADYNQSCAKVNIKPNVPLYMQGYNQGAKLFCTYDNGLKEGENGDYVSNTCKRPGLTYNFMQGYQQGYKLYEKQQRINDLQQKIDSLNEKIEAIRDSKVKRSTQDIDLLYREKELINQQIALSKSEFRSDTFLK